MNLRVMAVLMVLIVTLILIIDYSTSNTPGVSSEPVTETEITENYPKFYADLYRRDFSLLRPWLTHADSTVRTQAWRAAIHTPVEDPEELIDLALEEDSEAAWMALSSHPLEGQQLRTLEQLWEDRDSTRNGISLVLGQQGDDATLRFFTDRLEISDSSAWEGDYALALSRLITRHDLGEEDQIRVLQQALDRRDADQVRRYLYGFYRGGSAELTDAARGQALQFWSTYGVGVEEVDQYILGMLGEPVFHEITAHYNANDLLDNRIQLSVELARTLGEVELNARHRISASILIRHANPVVREQALASLSGRLEPGRSIHQYITGEMLAVESNAPVWLRAFEIALESDSAVWENHGDRYSRLMRQEPYMLTRLLEIYREQRSEEEYLQEVADLVQNGESLSVQYAIQSLGQYLNRREEPLAEAERERIRGIAFEALSHRDRGTAYATRNLLDNEELFTPYDFNRINSSLEGFRLPEDIEVYQRFGSLYHDRFRAQAEPVIDSLAALGYAPLNRSLADAGWDVEIPETADTTTFRTPEWDRLWELGRHPVWLLDTEKGRIAVQLDMLIAPATVSAIDSLTKAGAYDGVPFHRVVPNFVIQGGDFERGDGFGGPDFVIPTEASERPFERGAIGIASAGPDTEGSQYFIMHQWSPHLNGGYTRFGQVIEGMDVVDRIQQGDSVVTASWR